MPRWTCSAGATVRPDFKVQEGQPRANGTPSATQRITLVYIGDTMIELIQPPLKIDTTDRDALNYSYADTRAELGHQSEFIRLGDVGKAMFASVPCA